jgi:hypothetical protein
MRKEQLRVIALVVFTFIVVAVVALLATMSQQSTAPEDTEAATATRVALVQSSPTPGTVINAGDIGQIGFVAYFATTNTDQNPTVGNIHFTYDSSLFTLEYISPNSEILNIPATNTSGTYRADFGRPTGMYGPFSGTTILYTFGLRKNSTAASSAAFSVNQTNTSLSDDGIANDIDWPNSTGALSINLTSQSTSTSTSTVSSTTTTTTTTTTQPSSTSTSSTTTSSIPTGIGADGSSSSTTTLQPLYFRSN